MNKKQNCNEDFVLLSVFAEIVEFSNTVYAIIFAYSYFRGFGQVR